MPVQTPAHDIIRANVVEHQQVVELMHGALSESIGRAGALIADCLRGGGTVFWCGNGGSAADSQHLAAELVGRFRKNRRALRSTALTTDSSVLTCVANDFAYADIFARQLEALGRPGDLVVAISTSGASENILRALRAAQTMGITRIALLGKDGGAARDLADLALVVPSAITARIQESHILIGHILCELLERDLGFE